MKKFWQKCKGLLKSRTFWFNVLTAIITVADQLHGKLIPASVSTAAVVVGNVILRMLTNEGLEEKVAAKE